MGAAFDPPPEPDPRWRLRLSLEASGRAGLLPLLEEAVGAAIAGRFQLDGLLAAGRQCFVFEATDLSTGRAVVVKQPCFDYRRPVEYGRDRAARMRQSLAGAFEVLRACPTGHLPEPVALRSAPAVVPAAAESPVLSEEETFLIEERVCGRRFTEVALRVWPGLASSEREDAARAVAAEFVAFWEALHRAGWHYGDLNGENLLLDDGGRLRVLDGGAAVPAADEVVLGTLTPAFSTPNLYAAFLERRPVAGSLASVLPVVGKLLHFGLTRREGFNGRLPDMDHPALAEYSPACRDALAACLALDAHPEELAAARAALRRWTGPPPGPLAA